MKHKVIMKEMNNEGKDITQGNEERNDERKDKAKE